MSTAVKTKYKKPTENEWFETLERFYPLYPIQNNKDYKTALKVAEILIDKDRNTAENAYLIILSLLIESYEDELFKIETDNLKPNDVVKHLCDENNLSASDLGRILGDRSLGSKILNNQRQLSKSHIDKLSKYFSVDPCLFF